ncbi:MAG TPA: SDR family oxidoreductase [Gemmatimonadota bacterium]|nr:SDR family oxidoreductase [Gemmatimonadota bacterium]
MSEARRYERGAVLIIGASSLIARAAALAFARDGYDLILAGTPGEELDHVTADARVRGGVRVESLPFDARQTDAHQAFVESAAELAGDELAGAIVNFGLTGDPDRSRADVRYADEIIQVNYAGAASVLGHLANYFEEKRRGFIVGVSSVAGDRGRQSNYVYGSAKAGLSAYLQGLRNRLHHAGVTVVTVKPGFIDTRMTYGKVPPKAAADPEVVGRAIVRAVKKRKSVVYVPGYWRLIMGVVRAIPEPLFKRLKL